MLATNSTRCSSPSFLRLVMVTCLRYAGLTRRGTKSKRSSCAWRGAMVTNRCGTARERTLELNEIETTAGSSDRLRTSAVAVFCDWMAQSPKSYRLGETLTTEVHRVRVRVGVGPLP